MAAQYQLLPDLAEDEYEALKADIAERGVQVPIERDETGAVLDGHHRLRACEELGITEYPTIIRTGMDEDEKRRHVLALNLDRRHLTREQRKELTAKLRALGMSLRAIAKAENVSHETARNDLAGVNNLTPEAEPPAKVTGADGKQYPARRPASVITTTPRQTQAALDILQTDGAEPPKPISTVTELRQAAARERNVPPPAITPELPAGRYRTLVIDPPWPVK
jgi:ParB-like chromosome segregation protein Spo0J